MAIQCAHTGDIHLEEDRYFGDTAQCLEWFVSDAMRAQVDLFAINGDLTTYKQTIQERNFWIDMLIRMADHAPVVLVAGNHGKELDGDLHVFARARAKHAIYLSTEPEFIELGNLAVATFPYPRKADWVGTPQEQGMQDAFVAQLEEFNGRFARRPDHFRLFFGHFGVAGARISTGQPLVGRCAEYPLDPLRRLTAQYIGLSHVHLRQELAPRIWYAGSLSRCDYSETEEKGYNLVTLEQPGPALDLADLGVLFRRSPTGPMLELQVQYQDGEFRLPPGLDLANLKGSRVKVVVTGTGGGNQTLDRDEQNRLRNQLAAAGAAELKLKIEHEPDTGVEVLPVSLAKTAEAKLRAYWEAKGAPPAEQQVRLVAKLAQIETAVQASDDL